jgi:hypothetical protein
MYFVQLYIDSKALCSLQMFVTCLISTHTVVKSADFVLIIKTIIKTIGILFWCVVKSVYLGFVVYFIFLPDEFMCFST